MSMIHVASDKMNCLDHSAAGPSKTGGEFLESIQLDESEDERK